MTNYICINGKKAELTEEQLKLLGIELHKANPFERVAKDKIYYCISGSGIVSAEREDLYDIDKERFDAGNYCTDKEIMKQRALHETLHRLLWRYSMEHDGDTIDWKNCNKAKWYIFYDSAINEWRVANIYHHYSFDTFFHMKETAKAALEEIVKPFMETHPEFVL